LGSTREDEDEVEDDVATAATREEGEAEDDDADGRPEVPAAGAVEPDDVAAVASEAGGEDAGGEAAAGTAADAVIAAVDAAVLEAGRGSSPAEVEEGGESVGWEEADAILLQPLIALLLH
jgi:hypothetical protein